MGRRVKKETLRSMFPNVPNEVFEAVWNKLRLVRLSEFADLMRDLRKLGFETLTEVSFKDFKSNDVYRPDVLLVKPGNIVPEKVIILELKSGKHYDLKKLKKYKKLVEDYFAVPVAALVYLAGKQMIKFLDSNNHVKILKKGVKGWMSKNLRREKVSGTTPLSS